MSRIDLRPHQDDWINQLRYAFEEEGHQAIMGVAPTGFGKTVCIGHIAERAMQLNKRTFVCVHRKQLVKQTSKALAKFGIPHGVIASGYPEQNFPIQVCSIQSLARRINKIKPPDLIFNDEGHHVCAPMYAPVLEWAKNADAGHLAVTATPLRLDGKGFEGFFTKMVCSVDLPWLMDNGWLARPTLYAPEIEGIDLSDVGIEFGEFNKKQIGAIMRRREIIGSSIEWYKRLVPNPQPSLVFCASVEIAKQTAEEFTAAGIPSGAIDGSMHDAEIERVVLDLAHGRITCLMSCDLIAEGFDLSAIADMDIAIAVVVQLRPTHSLAIQRQQLGRALRTCTGKGETIIIDHVRNWEMPYGRVDDFVEWTLEGKKRKARTERADSLATCPKCYLVFPPTDKCPGCGHVFASRKPTGTREIEQRDGNLVEITSETANAIRNRQEVVRNSMVRKLERA